MTRKHLSADGKLRDCDAASPASCRAKGKDGGPVRHFESQEHFEQEMNKEHGTFSKNKRGDSAAPAQPQISTPSESAASIRRARNRAEEMQGFYGRSGLGEVNSHTASETEAILSGIAGENKMELLNNLYRKAGLNDDQAQDLTERMIMTQDSKTARFDIGFQDEENRRRLVRHPDHPVLVMRSSTEVGGQDILPVEKGTKDWGLVKMRGSWNLVNLNVAKWMPVRSGKNPDFKMGKVEARRAAKYFQRTNTNNSGDFSRDKLNDLQRKSSLMTEMFETERRIKRDKDSRISSEMKRGLMENDKKRLAELRAELDFKE